MDIGELVRAHGGVVRWGELRDAGISRARIDAWVTSGHLERVGHGLLATSTADPRMVEWRRQGARAACVTFAQASGLWQWRLPPLPHLGAGRSVPLTDCVVHRVNGSYDLVDALLSCCRCLPDVEALVLVESAVVLKRTTLGQLRERASTVRCARVGRVLERINPLSGSMTETIGRVCLQDAGFCVQCQVKVAGVGHVDLFVDGMLGIEVDSAQFHSDRAAYREDRRRWNALTSEAVPVLRVTYEMVIHEPEAFIALVRRTLERHASAPAVAPGR
ncbi:type IV toxin-antitoxin system AbiEi family antitoxin domain-containing protein [Tersicoccus solisilvae]|uniref:type IV toxin-antitoxin system AbiEi family antitoxin domain-containing protein n=1 Tax=Tersicoccus solisilvae TaxID=1882339 RepID=UPI0016643D41|nr:type IV toxin-antitoxin system AbiEi family antitoxin domain-containing protein [Tersicoccus solisilvae]